MDLDPDLTTLRAYCMGWYKRAAGEGALVELQLRIFCEAIDGLLQPYAHQQLESAEKAIADWFGDAITEKEKQALTACRQLRNKVLHCDFHQARGKLHTLGVPESRGDIVYIDVKGLQGEQMLAKLTSGESRQLVADAVSTRQVGVWLWLIEMASAGYLEEAAAVFERVSSMVDELLDRAHKIEAEKRRACTSAREPEAT